MDRLVRTVVVLFVGLTSTSVGSVAAAHGGGLNTCGCHFNRKTGECHCHRSGACGCACQPARCEAPSKAAKKLPPATR